ncbi:unnamed protein product [Amoebophrya sp. A25]|nr:unnamed protein product [Amoebophrya sp. A25]|eukprot:GSA25T00016847001.1
MTAVLGAMHHCLFITLAATAAPNMLKIPQERPVFLREYNARTYSVRAYLTAKFLADLPLLFISATSLLLVCYLLYGMQSNFVHHWILNFSIALAGSSLGTLLACLSAGTPGAGLGVILAPLILDSFPECFSSVMQPLGEIPLAFRWLSLFAPHAYAVSIAGDLEFDYIRTSSFPQGDSSPFAARREAYIQETAHRDPFTTLYWKNPLTTKMQMKDDEVETDGFNGYIPRFWFTVVLLVVISALLRVIACWNLARISRSLF